MLTAQSTRSPVLCRSLHRAVPRQARRDRALQHRVQRHLGTSPLFGLTQSSEGFLPGSEGFLPGSGRFRAMKVALEPEIARLARHAVAEVDDSRAEGASLDEFEVHPAPALGKERNATAQHRVSMARYSSIRPSAAASAARAAPPIAMSPSAGSARNRSISSARPPRPGGHCPAPPAAWWRTPPLGAASRSRPTRALSRRAMDPGRRSPSTASSRTALVPAGGRRPLVSRR